MRPPPSSARTGALATVFAVVVGLLVLTEPVSASTSYDGAEHAVARAAQDPRQTRGLFVDPVMPAANQEWVYASSLGTKAQALWIIPEAYPTSQVRDIVRAYTRRALAARKTPTLAVYGIPDRDCQQHSSGGLPDAPAYRGWIRRIAKGLQDQNALVVLEPDAIPFIGDPRCEDTGDRLAMLAFASKTLSGAGAWVYLDAGHSGWTPYDNRAALLEKAGMRYARGFSTNVSNFRRTRAEHEYAASLLTGLRRLGVRHKRYVIDTSRNGAPAPVDGDVYNPTWARVGKAPRLVFEGAFDGTLWIKHPGESDGPVNGGPPSGRWCDLLADRLLDRSDSGGC